jgi:hypothetical protein
VRKFQFLSLIILVVVLLAAILPASAAPGATINGITVDATNCTITLTFTVQDAGTYYVNAWDDGTFKAGGGVNLPAGGIGVATINFGVVLQGAAGLGLYVENGLGPAATTTFAANGSFQPNAPGCAGSYAVLVNPSTSICTNSQPTDYVIRPVPNGAQAYFAPAADKATNFMLPAGTWYTSPEPVDGFYQVWIACTGNPIYIPAEAVG